MTYEELVNLAARGIARRHGYKDADTEIHRIFTIEAKAALQAIQDADLAVVPREATEPIMLVMDCECVHQNDLPVGQHEKCHGHDYRAMIQAGEVKPE